MIAWHREAERAVARWRASTHALLGGHDDAGRAQTAERLLAGLVAHVRGRAEQLAREGDEAAVGEAAVVRAFRETNVKLRVLIGRGIGDDGD